VYRFRARAIQTRRRRPDIDNADKANPRSVNASTDVQLHIGNEDG